MFFITIYKLIGFFKSIYNLIQKEKNNIPQINREFLIQKDQIITNSDISHPYLQYGVAAFSLISLIIIVFYLNKDLGQLPDVEDINIPVILKNYPSWWDREKNFLFLNPDWREHREFYYTLNFSGPREINWVRVWKMFVITNKYLFCFWNSF